MSKQRTIVVSALVPMYKSEDENPNKMPEEKYRALVASIRASGFLEPIGVRDNGDGTFTIIGGHHRVRAAKEVGLTELPAIVYELGEKESLVAISLNYLRGDVDLRLAAETFKEALMEGFDVPTIAIASGFAEVEVTTMLENLPTLDIDVGDENVSPPDEDSPAPDKPFVLEIPFVSKEEYQLAKRKLKKAAGKGNDLARGLLNVLGEE